ncbi:MULTISPECIES: hypothetical protein [unclassified Microcoleus]|uniref:hypothetical protein n=1 Tax=unclassified Microcoleus TaxID=2642155 RepID=UPI002FD39062
MFLYPFLIPNSQFPILNSPLEGRRKKEEGRRTKIRLSLLPISCFYTHSQFPIPNSQLPVIK